MGDTFACQAVAHAQQITRHRAESANLFAHLPELIHAPETYGHRLAVNVESYNAVKNRIHHASILRLEPAMEVTEERNSLLRVLGSISRQQSWVRGGDQARLFRELKGITVQRPSSVAGAPSITFSCAMSAPPRMRGCSENKASNESYATTRRANVEYRTPNTEPQK
jgi:hypothetical protein